MAASAVRFSARSSTRRMEAGSTATGVRLPALDRAGRVKRKVAPFAGLALRPDAAAVRLDDGLADGEAEPGPASVGGLGLPEPIEDVGQVLGGDARPGVAHREDDPGRVLGARGAPR